MSFMVPPPFSGPFTAEALIRAYQAQVGDNYKRITDRNRAADLADAEALRERAVADGTLEDVMRILSPPVKRSPGRQPGSHSSKQAKHRKELWRAYESEKTKTPYAKDLQIATRLGKEYGNSPAAIAAHIRKIKLEFDPDRPSLLQTAGRPPRKRGRPKRTINLI
jgi:hypothetical protein